MQPSLFASGLIIGAAVLAGAGLAQQAGQPGRGGRKCAVAGV